MVVQKLLYGIPEAGTHWWATYHNHHVKRLGMENSTYDPCLLITVNNPDSFGIVGMQTDNTLILANDRFAAKEEEELLASELQAKPKDMLSSSRSLNFNGCIIQQNESNVLLCQKDQGKKIRLVDPCSDYKQLYVEQRARGAYIATICQPEVSFDLLVAAQHKNPTKEEVSALNKRLKWQLNNLDRGLKYIPLELSTAKLFVFVDGSFANNKDFSSQIGYEIILANENTANTSFEITGNLIHYSLTKSKRVTRSVLASEIYSMVGGIDMAISINTLITKILENFNFQTLPSVVCTDLFSLYNCLVKLGTTREKRLMIDIIAIRQLYEKRELSEIRWINGNDNPADAMTKANPNKALQKFIDTNNLNIRIEGWVQQSAKNDNQEL